MPKISIITPVYNTEQFLHNCIDSIREQDFKDWELLLVDDGSSDNSGKICDEYASIDNRIHVFHQDNGGASSARNTGLDNAKGEWITFIDSDDTIEQSYFRLYGVEDTELLLQRWRHYNTNDTTEHIDKGVYKEEAFIDFMEKHADKHIMRMVAAKFLKRNIIVNYHIRYNTSIRLGEDTLFMQEYYSHINSLSVSNTSYYLYYQPETTCSAKYILDNKDYRLFFQEFYKTYKQLPYKNSKLVYYLLYYFREKLKNPQTLKQRFFLNTVLSCLRLTKDQIIKTKSFRAHAKWYICFFLSPINHFLK